jgi:hypothetical protein
VIYCLHIVDFFPQLSQSILIFFDLGLSFFFILLKSLLDGGEFGCELFIGFGQKTALFLQGQHISVDTGLVEGGHYHRAASRGKQRVIRSVVVLNKLIRVKRNVFNCDCLFYSESAGS